MLKNYTNFLNEKFHSDNNNMKNYINNLIKKAKNQNLKITNTDLTTNNSIIITNYDSYDIIEDRLKSIKMNDKNITSSKFITKKLQSIEEVDDINLNGQFQLELTPAREISDLMTLLNHENTEIIFSDDKKHINFYDNGQFFKYKSSDNTIEKEEKKSNTNLNDILNSYFGQKIIQYEIIYDENIRPDFTQVKIDKYITNTVSNLTQKMGFPKYSFLREKLLVLSRPEWYLRTKNNSDEYIHKIKIRDEEIDFSLQNTISSIILLDYLAEIKNNFNPSTSGFLFESFIAGLIGGIAFDDNTAVDVVVPAYDNHKQKNYQMKLWSESSILQLNSKTSTKKISYGSKLEKMISEMSAFGDENFLLIGVKRSDKIDIYLIPFNEKTIEKLKRVLKGPAPKLSVDYLNNLNSEKKNVRFDNREASKIGTLKLNDFTSQLNSIKENLGDNLENLWKDIKTLQVDVENMITTDKKYLNKDKTNQSGRKKETSSLQKKALLTSEKIGKSIKKLYNLFEKKRK